MTEDKPISERVQKLEDLACQNSDEHKEIMKLLGPISDTYKTVNIMGRWLMAVLVLISILIGILASWGKVVQIFFTKK